MIAADGHLLALIGVDADRQIDPVAIAVGAAGDDRKILFFDRPLLELSGQREMRLIGLGHHEHAAGVAVEPMHDPRPRRSPRAAERIEMKLQRAGERAGPMPLGRMNDHPRRLVDRRQTIIFVENIERDILGPGRVRGGFPAT